MQKMSPPPPRNLHDKPFGFYGLEFSMALLCVKSYHQRAVRGFTLAELLIALTILAEIATFAIPKILTSQQNRQYNAEAKEVIAMVAAAYQQYQLNNTVTSSFGIKDITQYMNYVAIDTTTTIDLWQTKGTESCGAYSGICLRLHTGAYLKYWPADDTFGGTASTNAVPFLIDPDGKVTDGTTNGPGKSVYVWLYTNGRIVDNGNTLSGTTYTGGNPPVADPSTVPPWFSW